MKISIEVDLEPHEFDLANELLRTIRQVFEVSNFTWLFDGQSFSTASSTTRRLLLPPLLPSLCSNSSNVQ
jgi:hypothetical protein